MSEKQTTKLMSAKYEKNVLSKLFDVENPKRADQDEVAHYELPHLDLHFSKFRFSLFFCSLPLYML